MEKMKELIYDLHIPTSELDGGITVGELISKLETIPKDTPIEVFSHGAVWIETTYSNWTNRFVLGISTDD